MGTNGGYGQGRPRFTEDERRDILARHDRGESAARIARRYRCSPASIYYHLKITMRHIPLRDRYVAAPAVAGSGRCSRCGIAMGVPGMCQDCLEVVFGS